MGVVEVVHRTDNSTVAKLSADGVGSLTTKACIECNYLLANKGNIDPSIYHSSYHSSRLRADRQVLVLEFTGGYDDNSGLQ